MTAQEIVDTLNSTLSQVVSRLYGQQQAGFGDLTTCEQNLVYFSQLGQFAFNSTTGKFGIKIGTTQAVTTYTPYVTGADIDDGTGLYFPDEADEKIYQLNSIFIEFFTVPQSTPSDQTRIAKYFGMDFFPFQTFNNSAINIPLYYASFAMGLTGLFQYQLGMNIASLAAFKQQAVNYSVNNENATPAPPTAPPYAERVLQLYGSYIRLENTSTNGGIVSTPNLQYYFIYNPYPMNVNRYDQLYIRTSLNTNFWSYTGSKSDIMEIVPITTAQTALPQEHTNITRVYNTKDGNFRQFTITITDDQGIPVSFNDPYLLQLSVFFTEP